MYCSAIPILHGHEIVQQFFIQRKTEDIRLLHSELGKIKSELGNVRNQLGDIKREWDRLSNTAGDGDGGAAD